MNKIEQSRKYYLKNRDRILENVRVYREKNRKKIREKDREKYSKNKDDIKKYQKEYRKNNKEKVNAYQRKYRETHEKMRGWHNEWKRKWGKTPNGKLASSLKSYRRRALLKNDIGVHTNQEWDAIVKKHKGRCAICKQKKKITKDHIKALSRGGTNKADNLQPLCHECNARKGNRELSTEDTL